MLKKLTITCAALLLASQSVFAQVNASSPSPTSNPLTHTISSKVFDFDLPAGWNKVEDASNCTVTSPDGQSVLRVKIQRGNTPPMSPSEKLRRVFGPDSKLGANMRINSLVEDTNNDGSVEADCDVTFVRQGVNFTGHGYCQNIRSANGYIVVIGMCEAPSKAWNKNGFVMLGMLDSINPDGEAPAAPANEIPAAPAQETPATPAPANPLSHGAATADQVMLRPNFSVGMSWRFDKEYNRQSRLVGVHEEDHQVANVSVIKRISGSATVLKVADSYASSIRVTYDPGCEFVKIVDGKETHIPFVFAGKTITLSLSANGDIIIDNRGDAKIDDDTADELNDIISPKKGLYSDTARSVGDRWDSPFGAKCQLVAVHIENGRQVAEISISNEVTKQGKDGSHMSSNRGTARVDVQTGRVLSMELIGPYSESYVTQLEDAKGKLVPWNVLETGTESNKNSFDETAGNPRPAGQEKIAPVMPSSAFPEA